VLEHRRAKYACRHCREQVVVADMPAQPIDIDKGLAAPGLLAAVLVSKYQDHLPLYRQSQRFWRMGIPLSRSTLGSWVMACAGLLSPLVERMVEKDLLPCGHLFSDDTPIRVLDQQGPKTGRFWIYSSNGNKDFNACTVYAYTPTREGKWPVDFLEDFSGYLQADAYEGYDKIYADQGQGTKVQGIGGWAHARRWFHEGAQGNAKEGLAHQGLKFISLLYRIEAQAREQQLTSQEIKAWRQKRAPPILKNFKRWLIKYEKQVLPKSPLGEAIRYTLNHWSASNACLLEGYLETDNNRAERGIRPLALGRKNYLFVGNDAGRKAAAIFYSLLETCKQHKVNPHAHLKDVLERISMHPNARIDELLSYNWQPQHNTINRQKRPLK
jgi:Transposase and inactivated derivatives